MFGPEIPGKEYRICFYNNDDHRMRNSQLLCDSLTNNIHKKLVLSESIEYSICFNTDLCPFLVLYFYTESYLLFLLSKIYKISIRVYKS